VEGSHPKEHAHLLSRPSSNAERIDELVDEILGGSRPHPEPELRSLIETAALVSSALPPLPAGPRFEDWLAQRLADAAEHQAVKHPLQRAASTLAELTRRELKHPRRLIAAGAVSSAAVGVTAIAVWRGSRRSAANQGHR
jgi:hypothetical protein